MDVIVRPNDTLFYYSKLFSIPLDLIIQSNPEIGTTIQIGQKIKIPGYYVENYFIKPNDTLFKIAANYKIPLDQLFLLNPSTNPEKLTIGASLSIPKRIDYPIFKDEKNYTYEKMLRDIAALREAYPFIAQETIGHSVMGRNIDELMIGKGNKKVHINGSFHANEWITTPVIIKFINDYARALTNATQLRGVNALPLFQNTSLSIVPMVNPDGVNLVLNGATPNNNREEVLKINKGNEDFKGWKANIRGVDLNNQYPAKWEVEAARMPKSPAPRDFPGYAPLTEPEAIAMAELAKRRNFDRVIAMHTQGEEIYWGFEGFEPPEARIITDEFVRVSGYRPVQYLNSYAGFRDWFIQEFKQPGFTVEVGHGVNPLPIAQFDEIYEKSFGIMLANLYM